MAVIERPYKNSYSKNDIRYVFQLANLTPTGLYLQVKIVCADIGSSTFAELYTVELKPDINGVVFFYIQGYLDSLLKYVLPLVNQTVTAADAQAKQYYIEYREISDDNYDPVWNTDESSNIRIVIKGGVEKNKFDGNNTFSKYIETKKVFLTWQPAKHFVFGSDNVYMSYLNLNPGIQQLLKVTCTDVAGNQDVVTFPFSGANLLYHFCISSLFIFPAFSQKKNYCFDVSVIKISDLSVVVNPYKFFTEYRPIYKKQYELIYFNSLGGVDSVTISGETDVTGNRDYDDTEGGFNLDWTSPVNAHEASYTNIRYQRQFKGDIGFLRNRTKKQQEAFLELFVTTMIYHLIDSRWIPVTGLQKSVALGANTDTTQSFPIEWCLSESNEVFTPEDMMFGAGVNTSVCDPVQLASAILPDATVGVAYSASVAIQSGTLPINSVVSANKPSWMSIAYNTNEKTVEFSGTPNAAFSGSFEVVITNCRTNNFSILIQVNAADDTGGGVETGTHFEKTVFVSGNELNDNETTSISGQPGELIVVTVDNYVNGNEGSLTFNGTLVTAVGQTFNFTLDGTGSSGNIPVAIAGNSSGPQPSAIIGDFKITSTSGGSIGSSDTFNISKIF